MWTEHARVLRQWRGNNGEQVFDLACDREERRRAREAETLGRPIIYLTYAGMADCAVPIHLERRTIAMVWTGQLCPAPGQLWSRAFVQDVATEENIRGSVNAHGESIARNRHLMARMREEQPGCDPPDLALLAERARQIHPDEVPTLLRTLREASEQLGLLAERTVGYERNMIKAHFTSKVAELLPTPDVEFWSGFSHFLHEFASFLGMDYGFLYMLQREAGTRMRRFAGAPPVVSDLLPDSIAVPTRFFKIDPGKSGPVLLTPTEAEEHLFPSASLFRCPCYVMPLRAAGPLGIVVFGWTAAEGRQAELRGSGLAFLRDQCLELGLLIENRRQLQSRDIYVTDIAHEIRSPVAAVLASAENLAAGRISDPEFVLRTSSRLLSRLRGLQMAIERFMLLEHLLDGRKPLVPRAVPIYDVAVECAREYADMARERDMEIVVDRSLAQLPHARTDRDVFKHALANLVSNALKYGDPGTYVAIEGRLSGHEIKVDVRDVGIPIRKDSIPFLGQRHFRTIEACRRAPSGTGIGLTLVDRFLEMVNGRREVRSEALPNGRYHVIFSMYLPR